jgi:solute carrier family 35, member D1/2/3
MSRGSGGSIAAALTYCVVSVLLTLFNQAVFGKSGFALKATALLTLLQQLSIALGVLGLRHFGVIEWFPLVHDSLGESRKLGPFNVVAWVKLASRDPLWRAIAPLSISQMVSTVLSFVAMQRLALAMFTTLRRLAVVFVLGAQYVRLYFDSTGQVGGGAPSTGVLAGVFLISLGAVIAGATDLSFDLIGYLAMVGCNSATAFYTAQISSVRERHDVPLFVMLLYSAIVVIPVLAVGTIVSGELSYLLFEYEHRADPAFWITMLCSCALAFVLNYAVFWNVSANSPLTHEVTAQTKSFVTLLAGFLVFPTPMSMLNIVGVIGSLIGSTVYGYVRYREKTNESRPVLVTTGTGLR